MCRYGITMCIACMSTRTDSILFIICGNHSTHQLVPLCFVHPFIDCHDAQEIVFQHLKTKMSMLETLHIHASSFRALIQQTSPFERSNSQCRFVHVSLCCSHLHYKRVCGIVVSFLRAYRLGRGDQVWYRSIEGGHGWGWVSAYQYERIIMNNELPCSALQDICILPCLYDVTNRDGTRVRLRFIAFHQFSDWLNFSKFCQFNARSIVIDRSNPPHAIDISSIQSVTGSLRISWQ